jgi:tripartite-type tricarboxylate transporter receptor subunit TctC
MQVRLTIIVLNVITVLINFQRSEEEMMKKNLITLVVVLVMLVVGAGLLAAGGQDDSGEWRPERTITMIVPWGAGGLSDQTARVLASEMESVLGVKIAIVNQPGASGSIGTKAAYDKPHDGYTWVGNSNTSVATYQVRELTPEISHKDWQGFFAIFTPPVICVNPDSPITDWDSLLKAFQSREVVVASAGIGSTGHIAAELYSRQMGVSYKNVPYKGGNPAVVATVAGETEVVMQASLECSDMLRAKKLRPIAALTEEPIFIDGVGEIPPATEFKKGFQGMATVVGILIPRDTPAEIQEAIAKAFDVAANSEAVKKLASEKGAVAANLQGKKADEAMDRAASQFGWILYEVGVAPKSPEIYGIPKP